MNWTELKDKIYYCDGSLRDLYILDTNIDDLKTWIDFVNHHYEIKWFNGLAQKEENKIDFEVIQGYLNGSFSQLSSANIFLGKIRVNNHFFSTTKIENDIDPKEINSLQDHETLINYMINISKILDKTIMLTPENDQDTVLIKVMNEAVEFIDGRKFSFLK